MEERVDIMTDFQMRAIFDLIIKIVEDNRNDPDKVIEYLKGIRDEKNGNKKSRKNA